eukprot:Skav226739  [mRNA]  locus=scaffold720:385891:386499:- [translate_table: standard]
MASKHGGFLSRAAHSHPGSTRIASTAGTHAEQGHVQTADDAVQEAERVINQKHHSGSQGFKTEADDSKSKLSACLSSATFESALAILICLNVFLIIAETDVTAKGQDPPLWMDVANISFLIMYSIECVLKISAFRFAYFQDSFVRPSLLKTAVSFSCGKVSGSAKSGNFPKSLWSICSLFFDTGQFRTRDITTWSFLVEVVV